MAAPTPTVQTKQGKLKGKVSKTSNDFEFYTFKGIPYAKPPVGELRFSVWSDGKTKTKKKASLIHRDTQGTGGGPSRARPLNPLEERVLRIIGLGSITGHQELPDAGFPEPPPSTSEPIVRTPSPSQSAQPVPSPATEVWVAPEASTSQQLVLPSTHEPHNIEVLNVASTHGDVPLSSNTRRQEGYETTGNDGGGHLWPVCVDTKEVEVLLGCVKTLSYIPLYHPFISLKVTQPPEPWEGIRDATKNCNICAQLDKETNTFVGDEDCLYLNVYTPNLPTTGSELLGVMVFFHGGGFIFGNGTDDSIHGPDFLIEKNVVIVSINYRLGVLGFLSLNRKDAPGNMGLRDQTQALKWVKENIENFNGDPNNVTIFGISAGGASVEYQLLSPKTKGLFHKAIAQSGSTLLPWAHNTDIRSLAFKIPALNGKIITNDDDLLKYLKSLPTNELVTASMMVIALNESRGGIQFGFVPTIEKSDEWEPFLAKPPYKLLSSGEFNKVPYMTGFCTREGLLSLVFATPKFEKIVNEKKFVDNLPFDLDDIEKRDLEQKFKLNYLDGDKSDEECDGYAVDFFTDVDFLGGIYVAAKLIAKHNSPVYFYEFSYDGNLNYIKKRFNIDRKGACHGDDGGYLIKCDSLTDPLTDSDKAVRDAMTTMWTNFAKYGNPTPKTDNVITTDWEPIVYTDLACLVVQEKTKMKYQVYPQRMKLFEELFKSKCD